ncbi:hypothetical protein MA16_Dca012592 [Dendrobium catenatum]|uniref:Uncharacterized protein n=1 Tax=Dendrobium catenatum TaxID=906689 RepID=A0A2I0VKR4_9ASPA|nr:hypothetical protein MA16_Dca012592 [Dendrobium catenatum]
MESDRLANGDELVSGEPVPFGFAFALERDSSSFVRHCLDLSVCEFEFECISFLQAGEIEPQPPASSVSSGSDQAQASPTSAMEPGVSGSGKVQTAALVFLQINASPTAGFAVNMSNGGSEIAKDCRL